LDCSQLSFPPSDADCTDTNNPCKITLSPEPEDYENGTFKPGVFEVEICGTAVDSDPKQEKCTIIEVTLGDPCDPPTTFTLEAFED
jgi:hypothetical protein